MLTDRYIPNETLGFDEYKEISLLFPDDTVAEAYNNPMLCGERTYSILSATSFSVIPVAVTGVGPNY